MPPRFISCPPRYFFGRKKLLFLAGKNVEICDFRQKKPSDYGEDLFFFFWRSPGFGQKICDFGQKKPSDFSVDLFFGDHLLLAGKNVKILARKSLRKSAKTFAPPILILPPPISRSWRRPCLYHCCFELF